MGQWKFSNVVLTSESSFAKTGNKEWQSRRIVALPAKPRFGEAHIQKTLQVFGWKTFFSQLLYYTREQYLNITCKAVKKDVRIHERYKTAQ